jgi:DNA-binding HxlR family transcriptional regulator
MINEDLKISIEHSFYEIASILKTIGNQKRFKILISLLEGTQSFGYLLKETNLQRTALSNHLTKLININLIEKVNFGIYNITGDGLEFMKALDKAYYESPTQTLKRFDNLQGGKISKSFLHRFNPKSI